MVNKEHSSKRLGIAAYGGPCLQIACSECPSGVKLPGGRNVRLEHKNLANLVSLTDINCLTVLEWAIEVLRVEEIIILGHYNCKAVEAAIDKSTSKISGNWVSPIARIAAKYGHILDGCVSDRERKYRLCELNVLEQAANTCLAGPVWKAWDEGRSLTVSACIYDPMSGLTKDLDFKADSLNDLGSDSFSSAMDGWHNHGQVYLTA